MRGLLFLKIGCKTLTRIYFYDIIEKAEDR